MKELATYLPDEVQKLTLVCIASEADAAFAEERQNRIDDVEILRNEMQKLREEHAEEIERLKAEHVKAVMRIAVKHFDEIESLRKQAGRYEKLRSLNVRDFQALYMRNIRGEGLFDALVDQLPASGEKP